MALTSDAGGKFTTIRTAMADTPAIYVDTDTFLAINIWTVVEVALFINEVAVGVVSGVYVQRIGSGIGT